MSKPRGRIRLLRKPPGHHDWLLQAGLFLMCFSGVLRLRGRLFHGVVDDVVPWCTLRSWSFFFRLRFFFLGGVRGVGGKDCVGHAFAGAASRAKAVLATWLHPTSLQSAALMEKVKRSKILLQRSQSSGMICCATTSSSRSRSSARTPSP